MYIVSNKCTSSTSRLIIAVKANEKLVGESQSRPVEYPKALYVYSLTTPMKKAGLGALTMSGKRWSQEVEGLTIR